MSTAQRKLHPSLVMASDGFPRRRQKSGLDRSEPCKRHGRLAKLSAKLDARRQDFDGMRAEGADGTSKWVRTPLGKLQLRHRPGSLKA